MSKCVLFCMQGGSAEIIDFKKCFVQFGAVDIIVKNRNNNNT